MRHELMPIELWRHRIEFPDQADGPTFFGFNFGFNKHHFDAAENQQSPKYVENPIQPRNQGNTNADHETAHNQSTENAPEQHSMLVLRGNSEKSEDERDHENVIHRKRQL